MNDKKELSFGSALKVLGGRRIAGFGDKAEALAKYLDMDFSEVSPYSGNSDDNRFITPEGTYLVLTFDESVDEAEENILKEFRNYGLNSYFETRVRDAIIDGLDRDALRSIVDGRMYLQFEDDYDSEDDYGSEDDYESKLDEVTSTNADAVDYLENECGLSDRDLAEDLLSSGAIDPHTLASIVVEEIGAHRYIFDITNGEDDDGTYYFYKIYE